PASRPELQLVPAFAHLLGWSVNIDAGGVKRFPVIRARREHICERGRNSDSASALLRLVLFCAIAQDDGQRIECRVLNELQGVRVVMIEWFAPDQKLGFEVVSPASVIVEGYVAAIAGGAERLVQEFGRTDSVTRITALCRD